jgi:pimeloyl-ACP methyl ester carboxylesterase
VFSQITRLDGTGHGACFVRSGSPPERRLEADLAHPGAMSSDIRHVEANGLRFAYLEEGRGPLVLLLHGFPDTARSWDHARARIAARGFRAVSPWLRGYAPTAIPARDTDIETLGRDALALIGALGETSATVVGHDWGAAAAYAAASLEPARVARLIAIAIPHPAALRPTPAALWRFRHFIAYKLPGAAKRFARDDFAALPAIYRRWSPLWNPPADEFAAVRACFADSASLDAAFGYYRQLRFLPQSFLRKPIEVPTVAFAGLDDPSVSPADYAAARRMFQADYAVEEIRGGHFMHREHPDDFAAKLLAHLT